MVPDGKMSVGLSRNGGRYPLCGTCTHCDGEHEYRPRDLFFFLLSNKGNVLSQHEIIGCNRM